MRRRTWSLPSLSIKLHCAARPERTSSWRYCGRALESPLFLHCVRLSFLLPSNFARILHEVFCMTEHGMSDLVRDSKTDVLLRFFKEQGRKVKDLPSGVSVQTGVRIGGGMSVNNWGQVEGSWLKGGKRNA